MTFLKNQQDENSDLVAKYNFQTNIITRKHNNII